MKKCLFYLLISILVACSGNSEEEDRLEAYYKQAIIGSWAINTLSVDGELFTYQHTDGCEKDLFQFYNQEGKEFEFEEIVVLNCPNCAPCAVSQTLLNWELIGNKIILYFGEQFVLQYEIISVDETNFSYKFQFDIDNDSEIEEVIINAEYYDPYDQFI